MTQPKSLIFRASVTLGFVLVVIVAIMTTTPEDAKRYQITTHINPGAGEHAVLSERQSSKGPHGYPIVTITRNALVCTTSDRLFKATDDINRGSQMWTSDYPDCGVLEQGTKVEYDFEASGFSAGLYGYSSIKITSPDRTTSTEAFVMTRNLDHKPHP